MLDGLGRSLDRLRVSHADFFKQPADAAAAAAVNVSGVGDAEDAIRAAYANMPKSADGWVGLADLRERLGGLDRATVDDALRAMVHRDGVRIIPVANSKALQPRDRAAALRIGEEDNHALWIGPA